MRKGGLLEVLVRSVIHLYQGAKTRHDCELSEEFEVKVGMHQGSVMSPFLLAVVDVITELEREGELSDLLYAGDLVLMSVTTERLIDKFIEWKEAFERKNLQLILGKPR